MMLTFATAGYPALAFVVLVGAFGAPLPLTIALAAAGSLARQGRLDLALLFAVCLVSAVAGDCLGYAVGRFGLRCLPRPRTVPALLSRYTGSLMACESMRLSMGLLVFLTRWALTAPAPMVNLLAGIRKYPCRAFLAADVTGEALWCLVAIVPGYLLGADGELGMPLSLAAGAVCALAGTILFRQSCCLRHLAA